MRVSGAICVCAVALWGSARAEPLADSGAAKLDAYEVCRPVSTVNLGPAGSQAATECNGIVRNAEPEKAPDNLSMHCLEGSTERPEGYRYVGTCILMDGEGDKLYMTYEGTGTGQFKWVGGTGKFETLTGAGGLKLLAAPLGVTGGFGFTMTLDAHWSRKAKE